MFQIFPSTQTEQNLGHFSVKGLRMKFAKKLTATIAVCASVTFAGAGVSRAKVFHGHWIGGRIEEAYHRLGGWQTFGDAII
ncbi:hypothetical protein FRC0306_01254 [Corynebacterium diphtheriae]|nr:hypothetical protein FRC0306_01254 [Corynebacterium diphtheriae]